MEYGRFGDGIYYRASEPEQLPLPPQQQFVQPSVDVDAIRQNVLTSIRLLLTKDIANQFDVVNKRIDDLFSKMMIHKEMSAPVAVVPSSSSPSPSSPSLPAWFMWVVTGSLGSITILLLILLILTSCRSRV